jgi:toxin HigB-1
MIRGYVNAGTRDLAEGLNSKAARKLLPRHLHACALLDLAALDSASSLKDLDRPGYRLQRLAGNRTGQYSIRINRQYRICFFWEGDDATGVEIVDYHRE